MTRPQCDKVSDGIGWSDRARRVLACAIVMAVAACGDDSAMTAREYGEGNAPVRTVVAYVSADEAVARPILDAFTRESGIEVRARFDGEASKTTALAAMLRVERESPRADLFWSSEALAAPELAREGVLAPWRSRRADALPEQLRGEAGRWYGFSPRMRVLVFDPARTSLPATAFDLSSLNSAGLAGRVAIADPRFGTTRAHIAAFAAMLEQRSPGAFEAWASACADANMLIVAGGNAAVVDAVLRGEAAFGLTDSDDYYAAKCGGGSLSALPLRQFGDGVTGGGPMLIPNTLSLVSGAPHAAEAAELMDFLLSDRVARWLHASRSGNFIVEVDGASGAAASPALDPPAGLQLIDAACEARLDRAALEQAVDHFIFDEGAALEWADRAPAVLRRACEGKASR